MSEKYNEGFIKNIELMYGSIEEYERQEEIRKAQKYLKDTDYIIIKLQEYAMQGKKMTDDYSKELQKREECREIIRKLK